jgi:hypothetical protein
MLIYRKFDRYNNIRNLSIRKVSVVLCAFILAWLCICISDSDTEVKADDTSTTYCSSDGLWNYTLDEAGNAVITGCGSNAVQKGILDIPSVIDTYKVTGIEEKAFYKNTSITQVNIPDSMTFIGANAFNSCTSLSTVDIPENLVSFGSGVFWGTPWLTEKRTERADKLVIINGVLIDGISASGNISIPATVKYVAPFAFYESGITGVTFSNSDTELQECAFYEAVNLTSITLPENITVITSKSLSSCTSLSSVTIPASVETIESYAFNKCTKLAKVTFAGANLKTIGSYSFRDCSALDNVVLPDSLERLEDYVFWNCTSLKTVTIPESISYFGALIFYNTPWLTSMRQERTDHLVIVNDVLIDGVSATGNIEIPDGVKTIASGAFYGRVVGTSVTGADITGVTMPDSLVAVNSSAFLSCSSLTNVELSPNITYIGNDTFKNCNSLTEIWLPEALEKLGTDAFPDNSAFKLYIPSTIEDISNIPLSGYSSLSIIIPENHPAIYSIVNNINVTCYVQTDSGELKIITKEDVTTEEVTTTEEEKTTQVETTTTEEEKTTQVEATTTEEEKTTQTEDNKGNGGAINNITNITINNTTNNTTSNNTTNNNTTNNNTTINNNNTNITISKQTSIANATVVLKYKSCNYTGKAKKPSVTVKLGSKKLTKGKDYKVKYINNKKIGKASVIITGIGSYNDSVTRTFKIVVKKGTVFKSKSLKYKITGSSTVAFAGVSSKKKTELEIPDTVTYGGKTFKVTSVTANAVKGNKYIEKVTIGNNVKTIGSKAFMGCKKLKTVTIGKKVTTIGTYAFASGKNITIKINSKVIKKFGRNCFKPVKSHGKYLRYSFAAVSGKGKAYGDLIVAANPHIY